MPQNGGTATQIQPKKGFSSQRKIIVLSVAVLVIVLATLVFLMVGRVALLTTPIKALGNCLDNTNARQTNANAILMYKCNDSRTQNWALADDHTIRFGTVDSKYCLSVRDSSTAMKVPAVLWECRGFKSQKWIIQGDGSIINQNSGLCLDVRNGSTAESSVVWQYNCNGSAAQKWTTPPTITSGGASAETATPLPNAGADQVGTGLCTQIPNTSNNFTKPDSTNTGVPSGTALSTDMPAGAIDSPEGWKVTAPGTIIDGQQINKPIIIQADDVTIKNSKISVPTGTLWAIDNENGNKNMALLNSEVSSVSGAVNGIGASDGTKVCGVNAHGFENIANIEANNVVFQSNYFHVNQADPGKSDPHNNAIEVRVGKYIKLLGNNLRQTNPDESWQHNASTLYIGATWGDIDEISIACNWLGGGTSSLQLTTVPAGTSANLLHVDVNGNKWYRNSAADGPIDIKSGLTPHTWTNNTWLDTGQIINR